MRKHKLIVGLIGSALQAVSVAGEYTFPEHQTGKIDVKGPGDFSHQSDTHTTNFRLRSGETQTIDVRPGDRLKSEPATLPDANRANK